MTTHPVIDSYVADVVRRLPRGTRAEIAAELRGLLGEMLHERAQAQGGVASDATVLAMLREFGAPADVADRYREPGLLLMRPTQTRRFALLSFAGIALQWAATLPRVFDGSLDPGAWWFGNGLGALWWPGFLAMGHLLGAWLRARGWLQPRWKPRDVDPDRIARGSSMLGLVAFATGALLVATLPWLVPRLPGVLPEVLAFDPVFLRQRAAWVLPLYAAGFVLMLAVHARGRWSPLARKLDIGGHVAFLALLGWWISGPIFLAPATDQGARAALALVMVMVAIGLAANVRRLVQLPGRIPTPPPA
jgi:hypothetical protein